MGSQPSSLNKSSSVADHKMADSIAYQNIILVKTKPWDSKKRSDEFPSDEVMGANVTLETTIIDVEITHPTLTEKDFTERDIFPMPYVNLDNDEEQEYYTLKNANGQVVVSVEPRIPKRNAIFTFHVKRKGKQTWDQYHVRKEKGDSAVSIETDQLDIDTVFITSQPEVQTVEVPPAGCVKHLDPDDENMKIEFLPESVKSTMEVTIEVTSLDDNVKEKKLEKLFGKDHGILGISDLVNVTHEENFLVPVKLTLAIQPLQNQPDGELPASLVLYVEDATVEELEQATVEKVTDTLFTISTNHFCPVTCVRMRPNVRRLRAEMAVRYVYDLDDPRCTILLFSKQEGSLLYLRSEIVSEDDRIKKEQERKNGMGMRLLSICTSPTVRLKNMDRVRVTLANHTAIKFATGIPQPRRFIVYDRNNQDNSLSFFAELNKGLGVGNMATLEYDLDCGRNRRSLHKATFSALKEMKTPSNLSLSRFLSQDTLNTDTGLMTTYYRRQVSDSGYSGSSGITSVGDGLAAPPPAIGSRNAIRLDLQDWPKNSPPTAHALTPRPSTKNKTQEFPEVVQAEKHVIKTEAFSERSLTLLARQIPDNEYHSLATLLGISFNFADRLMQSLPDPRDRNQLKLRLLLHWIQNESMIPSKRLKTLTEALVNIEQRCLAEKVEEAFEKNRPFKP